MVTLRRDIAANKSGRKENLTNYDVFMQSRNKADVEKSVILEETGIKSYAEYLFQELNRTKKEGSILSESEYYKRYLKPLKDNVIREDRSKVKKQLTKFGKIFLSFYVLITIAIASIILVTNNDKTTVSANDGGVVEVEK